MADSNAAAERAEREERLASDLEEVEAKLNNCRENVETLMLQVITSKKGFTTTSRNQSILGPEVIQKAFFQKIQKNSKKFKRA